MSSGGNIAITLSEIATLRNVLIQKYAILKGEPIELISRKLNSNIDNYKDLSSKIFLNGSLQTSAFANCRPLTTIIYYSSRENDKPYYTFRKKFINRLYEYLFGQTRETYLKTNETPENSSISYYIGNSLQAIFSSISEKYVDLISGYWECYYDRTGTFRHELLTLKKASLKMIPIFIGTDSDNNLFIETYQKGKYMEGSIEIRNSNFIIQNTIENIDRQFLVMNFGQSLENFHKRGVKGLDYSVGIYLHLTNQEFPKSGKCIMIRKNGKVKSHSEFKTETILKALNNRKHFSLNNVDPNEEDRRLREYFFTNEINVLQTSAEDFKKATTFHSYQNLINHHEQ